MSVVYIAHCTKTGMSYVGQTCNFELRKHQHLSLAFKNKKNLPKFYQAIREHGAESFKWSVISVPEEFETTAYERAWIERLDSIDEGYNCSFSRVSYGIETRLKMSRAHAGKKLHAEHAANIAKANKGKKHSPEWSKKISESLVGRKLSIKHRAKISALQNGRSALKRTKKKMSISQKIRRLKERILLNEVKNV